MDKLTNFEKKLIKAFINKVDGWMVIYDKANNYLRLDDVVNKLTTYCIHSLAFGFISAEESEWCDYILLELKKYAISTAKLGGYYSVKYDEFIDILKYGYPCKIVEE